MLINGTRRQEKIYLNCLVYAFATRRLKKREDFCQLGAEKFYTKAKPVRPIAYRVQFLEDRIRFRGYRLAARNKRHSTVPYRDIRGAYSVYRHPNHLILGIEYPERGKSKYEVFVFDDLAAATKAKEILLEVKQTTNALFQEENSFHQTLVRTSPSSYANSADETHSVVSHITCTRQNVVHADSYEPYAIRQNSTDYANRYDNGYSPSARYEASDNVTNDPLENEHSNEISNGTEKTELTHLLRELEREGRDSVIYVDSNIAEPARRGSVFLYCKSSPQN